MIQLNYDHSNVYYNKMESKSNLLYYLKSNNDFYNSYFPYFMNSQQYFHTINPLIKYGSLKNNIPVTLALNILQIPHQQRSLKDHELIYKFLVDNPVLNEIQRKKSVNARLQCVAKLQIREKEPAQDDQLKYIAKIKIIDENQKAKKMKQFKEKQTKKEEIKYLIYFIVLEKETYIDIMAQNQKHLRQTIQILKKYTILNQMKYEQLLHLSYYLQKQSFKYKQVVYKEGDPSLYVYLVEEGQFHYFRQVQQNDQVINTKKQIHKPKRYVMLVENPNKKKNSKSVELQIGIIQGKCGQAFGQEQVVSEKCRQYSVRCMSTENIVYKIKKEYYQNVIRSSRTQMDWLRSQKQKIQSFKKDILNSIVQTKHNYSKYLKVISQNSSHAPHEIEIPEKTYNQESSAKKQKPVQSFITGANDTGFVDLQKSRSINQHLKSQSEEIDALPLKNIIKSEQSSEEAYDTFALTKPIKPKKSLSKNQSLSIQSHLKSQASKNETFLPSISGKSSKIAHESIETQKVKSWSASRPAVELRDMRSKFTRMIDSNALIREKQYILMKKMPKQQRDDIFPIDLPKKKNKLLKEITQTKKVRLKQELRELRSAAHSKNFMQKLLIDSLSKAGYNTAKNSKQQNGLNNSVKNEMDSKSLAKKPKRKKQLNKIKNSISLLQENPFDEYYFKKDQQI